MHQRSYLYIFVCFFLSQQLFAQISFSDQTAALLESTDFHSGVAIAVVDMNNDLLDDIVHLNDGRILNIEFQVPGGKFINMEYGSISGSSEWTICAADVDNNSFTDVITGGFYNNVKLVKADNSGSSYSQSNLPGASIFSQGSNFADIDNDGFVDVFVCHDDGPSRIWQNNGDGTYSIGDNMINLAIYSGIENNSGNYGSVWTDFDSDGDLDLYIAKCRQGVNNPSDVRRINQLWENDGNGNYTENAAQYNLASGAQSWTTEFGDIDNDGDMDAFMTNHDVASALYENLGDTTFLNFTGSAGLNVQALPIQGIMKDFDNDGFLDILVAGSNYELYLNDGDKTFTKIDGAFGNQQMESYAIGDLNHDGFLDVYAGYANIYTNPSNIEDAIFINSGNSNNWLAVNTVGTVSNRSAIGARLELYGDWGIQVREVRAGESYGIVNSFSQHFGMGSSTTADSLVIKWPSGLKDVIPNPTPNQYITVIENTCVAPQVAVNVIGSTVICDNETAILEAPAGYTDYEWSTGETTQSITVGAQGSYFVRVSDGTGCFGISEPVFIESSPVEIPEIAVTGELRICLGDLVTLSSTEATSYIWSNGATTQSVDITESGSYFVEAEGQCGFFTSDLITIEVNDATEPLVNDTTITEAGPVTLTATGDSLIWYDQASGGITLASGSSLDIPLVDATTTFYVENLENFGGDMFSAGLPNHVGGSNYSGNNFNSTLIFDVLSPFILRQVKVYTDIQGMREIQVYDSNNNLIQSTQALVPVGESYITLNFMMDTPGDDYYLTTNESLNIANFGFSSPRFRRSSSGVNYPYVIDDVVEVKDSEFGPQYYYYFFDWQIETEGLLCTSDRVPVVVTLDPATSIFDPVEASSLQVFPNPTTGLVQVEIGNTVSEEAVLEVLDINGRLVFQQTSGLQSDILQVDLSTLAKGLYIIRVQDLGKTFRAKVALH